MNTGTSLSALNHFLRGERSFKGGVHPHDFKSLSKDVPIRPFPFSPVMNIPLAQHIGQAPKLVVREGQEVVRGQLLAKPDGFVSVALHAPASGVIQRIGLMPDVSGKMQTGIYLKPFPGSTQEVLEGEPCRLEVASAEQIISAIQQAGIVGLGGAAFPTHVKLKIPKGKFVDTLIINGAECEPYLTNDYRVMLEQQQDILTGIGFLLKATGAERAIIGLEDNKIDAADSLREFIQQKELPNLHNISVKVVQTKYPQGAEKMLVEALLDRCVPAGGLPLDVHVVSVNVSTVAEIGRLLPHGRGIQERVITISGPAINKPGNYRIPIGTPLRFALEQAGVADNLSQVFLGGPMMGMALPSLDISITKGISGVLAFTEQELAHHQYEYPCIRCAYCVDVCPMSLNPAQLGVLARNQQYDEMVKHYHLMDCFECGSCSFVCPSHIPLVQSFRAAKSLAKKHLVKP